jgi:hypothetical protein
MANLSTHKSLRQSTQIISSSRASLGKRRLELKVTINFIICSVYEVEGLEEAIRRGHCRHNHPRVAASSVGHCWFGLRFKASQTEETPVDDSTSLTGDGVEEQIVPVALEIELTSPPVLSNLANGPSPPFRRRNLRFRPSTDTHSQKNR